MDFVLSLLFLIVVSRAIDLALRCFEDLGFRESAFTKKASKCWFYILLDSKGGTRLIIIIACLGFLGSKRALQKLITKLVTCNLKAIENLAKIICKIPTTPPMFLYRRN